MAGESHSFKSPQDSCNEVLKVLRESNLHFIVNESPYSVQICVRKKFLNHSQEYKASVPSSTSLSATIVALEKKNEDLSHEKKNLVCTLEEVNERINNLNAANKILHKRIESVESEYRKEKNENNKKFMDAIALNKAKIKSLEKTVKDGKKKLDNAHDAIAKLKTGISSENKPAKKKLGVGGESLANAKKDENENNIHNSLIPEPDSGSKTEMSPVRSCSPSRSPPGTPSSPHTPPGPPPSSFSSQLQPSATLSCYFENLVQILVKKQN